MNIRSLTQEIAQDYAIPEPDVEEYQGSNGQSLAIKISPDTSIKEFTNHIHIEDITRDELERAVRASCMDLEDIIFSRNTSVNYCGNRYVIGSRAQNVIEIHCCTCNEHDSVLLNWEKVSPIEEWRWDAITCYLLGKRSCGCWD